MPTDIRVGTLQQLARAFDVTLRVRFCAWGSLLEDVASMARFADNVPSFDDDPTFADTEVQSDAP
jgi:hypothetical protein